ncbi:YggS family pyridoxal phosphate-dependent enzyme [bacterium]|nr:MAG: YggS family pyridoxal phosphate-dependent enzyme [bacterium]
MMHTEYQNRLQELNQRIEYAAKACGRNPSEIKLIAVSKTHPVDAVKLFYELGHRAFGENKVQEMVGKWEEFPKSDIEWHMIGAMQSNKIKYLAPRVNWIHSISKVSYLDELEKRLKLLERTVNVLIQVNISDEDQKSGCEPEQLPDFFKKVEECEHIKLRGLMGIASLEKEPEDVRPQFKQLADLLKKYQKEYQSDKIQLTELSMGMTGDLEVAIEEGATMIRVGTALFGNRDYIV